MNNKEPRALYRLAANGRLPEGFDRWDLAGDGGWSVAHEAAASGLMPAGFDRWDISME